MVEVQTLVAPAAGHQEVLVVVAAGRWLNWLELVIHLLQVLLKVMLVESVPAGVFRWWWWSSWSRINGLLTGGAGGAGAPNQLQDLMFIRWWWRWWNQNPRWSGGSGGAGGGGAGGSTQAGSWNSKYWWWWRWNSAGQLVEQVVQESL